MGFDCWLLSICTISARIGHGEATRCSYSCSSSCERSCMYAVGSILCSVARLRGALHGLLVRHEHWCRSNTLCCLQERGLRSGTVPAPLAIGFGAACEIASQEPMLQPSWTLHRSVHTMYNISTLLWRAGARSAQWHCARLAGHQLQSSLRRLAPTRWTPSHSG